MNARASSQISSAITEEPPDGRQNDTVSDLPASEEWEGSDAERVAARKRTPYKVGAAALVFLAAAAATYGLIAHYAQKPSFV
jgi:type VI protein secretion system component VasF